MIRRVEKHSRVSETPCSAGTPKRRRTDASSSSAGTIVQSTQAPSVQLSQRPLSRNTSSTEPSIHNLLQGDQQPGFMPSTYSPPQPGEPATRTPHEPGNKYVPIMIDRSATDLPYFTIQAFSEPARLFWSRHSAYEGFINSNLWQSERGKRGVGTRCMSIWLGESLMDAWIVISLRYKEGVGLLDHLGVEARPGHKSAFSWDLIRGFLAGLCPAVEASQLRKVEHGAQSTNCMCIRVTDEGEDMFLAFCIGFSEGMQIQAECTTPPKSTSS